MARLRAGRPGIPTSAAARYSSLCHSAQTGNGADQYPIQLVSGPSFSEKVVRLHMELTLTAGCWKKFLLYNYYILFYRPFIYR
jgi:hypothetical protein